MIKRNCDLFVPSHSATVAEKNLNYM